MFLQIDINAPLWQFTKKEGRGGGGGGGKKVTFPRFWSTRANKFVKTFDVSLAPKDLAKLQFHFEFSRLQLQIYHIFTTTCYIKTSFQYHQLKEAIYWWRAKVQAILLPGADFDEGILNSFWRARIIIGHRPYCIWHDFKVARIWDPRTTFPFIIFCTFVEYLGIQILWVLFIVHGFLHRQV